VTRRRFMLLNFLGSLLWGASFIIAGYVCGGLLGMAVGNLAEDLGLVLLGGLILGLALRRLTQRMRQELR
jgi:membrane protein DedA with SNARE-associated domain